MPEKDLKLYALLVGGSHARATIELHDVQFVIARSVEETFPVLRERWWGTPSSLHLDAYAEIAAVDGHFVRPLAGDAPESSGPSLYFVNTGGYEDGVFGELHAYSFHVGSDKRAIWQAARERAAFGQKHQDNFDIIDDVVCVNEALAAQRYGLALEAGADPQAGPLIVAKYVKFNG